MNVELDEKELEHYISISKKLLKFFDFEKGVFKKDPIVEKLLLKRKNIIHKAKNKENCFKENRKIKICFYIRTRRLCI